MADNRYFITEVYTPAGCRTLERQLAQYARSYEDHILSEGAMLRLADELKAEQERIRTTNKRLLPLRIDYNFDGDGYGYRYRWFHMGQVSIHFRLVAGEII